MNTFIRNIGAIISVAVLCASCAHQVKPMGGDIDETPPRILNSDPQNESVNFSSNEINFEFDEYVRLKAANQELVVSPPLKYPVEFKLKGKKLNVSWKDTLSASTTYLFQFGEGIVDLNEGNPLDSNIFVFSTGPYLDSFSMKGQVIDAFTLKPVPDVWVMLYNEDIDSLPYLEMPRYFGKTGDNGLYQLNYLAPGNYKVFALLEEGSGYLYDLPTEQIGFIEQMIESSNAMDTSGRDSLYIISLFLEEDSTQYILGTEQLGQNGLKIQFNATVDRYFLEELTGLASVSNWTPVWNKTRDTLTYWFDAALEYDSLRLRIEADDFTDTVMLRKPVARKARGRDGASAAVTNQVSLNSRKKLNHFDTWKIKSKTPIGSIKSPESIVFKEGNDTIDLMDHFSHNDTHLIIDYKWKEGQSYSLLLPDSTIFDRFGNSHDTLSLSTTTTRKEDFGSLLVTYNLPDNGYPYLWQLKIDDKVIDQRSISSSGTVKYKHLETGKYSVKLLHDENGNGIWDTGYYPKKRQPEAVSFYDEKIEVRSNWETEIDWNLDI